MLPIREDSAASGKFFSADFSLSRVGRVRTRQTNCCETGTINLDR